MILTHYFPLEDQNNEPLRVNLTSSIMEYSKEEQKTIAQALSHYPGRAMRRFDKFNDYILRRIRTEEWLYSTFLKTGGYPTSVHPFYFILGESQQLKLDFGVGAGALQLDTDFISSNSISFTLGDSVGIYFSSAPKKIYHLDQIKNLFSNSEFIQQQMQVLEPYHRYIEAQLWDKHYLDNASIIRDYLTIVYIIFLGISTHDRNKFNP